MATRDEQAAVEPVGAAGGEADDRAIGHAAQERRRAAPALLAPDASMELGTATIAT